MTNKRNRLEKHSPFEQTLALLLASFLLAGLPTTVLADNVLGNEGNITAGSGTINAPEANGIGGQTQVIEQTSPQMLIDYNNAFDIPANDILVFEQGSEAAKVINRVIDFESAGISPSQLLGQIQATGEVYVINPAGIFVGSGAVIDTAGFFAIGAALSNETGESNAALLDRFNTALESEDGFTFQKLSGRVSNLGSIRADLVALAGNQVENQGNIEAISAGGGGMIAMVAGDSVIIKKLGGEMGVRFEDVGSTGTQDFDTGVLNTGSLNAGREISLLAAGDMYAIAIQQSAPAPTPPPALSATNPNPGTDGGYDPAAAVTPPSDCTTGYCAVADTVVMDGTNGAVSVTGDVVGSDIDLGGDALGVDLADVTVQDRGDGSNGKLTLRTTNWVIEEEAGAPEALSPTPATDITIDPTTVVAQLDGADLDLKAKHDIDVNDTVDSRFNPDNGSLGLYAGRDLNVNTDAQILLRGSFTGRANDPDGEVPRDISNPTGDVTFADGTAVQALGGDVDIDLGGGDRSFDTTAGEITLPATVFASGDVNIEGTQVLAEDTTLEAGNDLTLTGNVSGPYQLTAAAGNDLVVDGDLGRARADVTVPPTPGAESRLAGVDLTADNDLRVQDVLTQSYGAGTAGDGGQTYRAGGSTIHVDPSSGTETLISNLSGDNVGTPGDIEFLAPVILEADTVVESDANVRFAGTINAASDGGAGLTVNTPTGDNRFEDQIGTGTDGQLAYLETDAGGSGGTTHLAAVPTSPTVQTTGDQTYNDDVLLEADQELLSTAGSITFQGYVDSADNADAGADYGLTVNTPGAGGNNRFELEVGGGNVTGGDADGLAYLTTDDGTASGETRLAAFVTTSGDQTYNDDVVLEDSITFTGTDVTFNGDLNADVAGGQGASVDASGTATFGDSTDDVVGGAAELFYLNADAPGTTRINAGSVETFQGQTYGDDVVLGAGSHQLTSDGYDIEFQGHVDSVTPAAAALTVNTTGDTIFRESVGTGQAAAGSGTLSSLVTDAGGTTRLGGGTDDPILVATDGSQNYGDDVVLESDAELSSVGGDIGFAGDVDSAVADASGLVVNTPGGNNEFQGDVGSNGRLESLQTDVGSAGGYTEFSGPAGTRTVDTLNAQLYNDDVLLSQDAELTSANGAVEFRGHVDSATPNAAGLTVNTAGSTVFRESVGTGQTEAGSGALASLETDAGGTTTLGGGSDDPILVATDLDQDYGDAVELASDAELSSANGTITFGDDVDSAVADASGLVVNTPNGRNIFEGNVGSAGRLESLQTDVGSAGGYTEFAGTGGTSTVDTLNAQIYNDDVLLSQDAELASANGAIEFRGHVDSATPNDASLVVNTDGSTVFRESVGTGQTATGSGALASLETDAGGTTTLGGGSDDPIQVVTDGGQDYGDAVLLESDAELSSANGRIEFADHVDSATPNAAGLTVDGDDGIFFRESVGTGQAAPGSGALASLTTLPGGGVLLGGGSDDPIQVVTDGDQSYGDAVAVLTDAELTSVSGSIEFDEDVSSGGAALSASAGEDLRIGGDIETMSRVALESNTAGSGDGNIIFDGTGRQVVLATESITLNTNRGAPPEVATIYKTLAVEDGDLGGEAALAPVILPVEPPDLIFDAGAGTFAMSRNDKLSVPEGRLGIGADAGITIGDLNALGGVQIGGKTRETAQLTALGRAFGPVLLADGTTKDDVGIEIISNKIDIYAANITTDNGGTLYVVTPSGDAANGVGPGEAVQRAFRNDFRDLTAEDFFLASEAVPGDDFVPPEDRQILDQIALGPGFVPLDVIPYVPTEEEKNPSGTANRNAVAERPLRPDELLSFFDCMEKTEDQRFECEEEYVGTERAASPEAEKLRALAADLFVDTPTGESPEQRDKRILENAVVAYKSRTGAGRIDGPAFRRFLETSPQQADALAILDKYGQLLQGVREFGATDEAYEKLKTVKLERITPAGLTTEELGNAVEAGMTARPVERGVRVASSDRFYLYRGLESRRLYLVERDRAEAE